MAKYTVWSLSSEAYKQLLMSSGEIIDGPEIISVMTMIGEEHVGDTTSSLESMTPSYIINRNPKWKWYFF